MAINADNLQNEEKKDEQNQSQVNLAGSGGSNSGQTNTGRVAATSSGAPTGQKGSGRFTNLSNYINANQGAGQQLGSKITGNIEKNLNKASDNSQSSQIAQNLQNEQNRLGEGSTFQTQVENDPTQITQNADQTDRFKNLLNNQNVAANLEQQRLAAQNAQNSALGQVGQNIQNLNTEQGRFNLLQGTVKNPGYTSGQQRLDQLFLQTQNPNQLVNTASTLNKQLGGAQNAANTAYSDLQTGISGAGQLANQVSTNLGNTLNTQTGNLVNSQVQQATDLNSQNALSNAAMNQFFTNGYGTLSADQKALIDPMLQSGQLSAGMRTYNVLTPDNYQNYYSTGRTDLSGKDALDANEFARYQALSNLASTPAEQQAFTQAGDLGPAATIKSQQLAGDINNARSALETQLNRDSIVNSQVGGSNTANVNLLDLLKYAEGGYNSNITPIFGRDNNNGASGNIQLTPRSTGAATEGFGTGHIVGEGGVRSAQQLIEQYLAELDKAGYNQGLGGVTPAANVKK